MLYIHYSQYNLTPKHKTTYVENDVNKATKLTSEKELQQLETITAELVIW